MAKTGKIYYVDVEFTDAQVAAQFTFPCMFFLRNAEGQIIKHITYDLNGEKSVAIYSMPEDRVLTLGTITATTITLTLALHSSGVNSVLMAGVVRSKTEGDEFTFAPVSPGKLKYLLLIALPDAQLFYIIEGVEGNEAIYPDLPPGALLIKAVLISEFGALLEDADGGYKPLAEDPWRNIVINSNAAVNIIVASSPSASFNVLVGAGVTAPKIAAIKTKVKKNTRDGQEITFYNDSDTPVAFLAGDYEETLVYTTFPFADNYEIEPRSFAKFKRKENKYHELAGGGSASFPEGAAPGDVLTEGTEGPEWSNRLTNVETNKQDKSMFSALVDKMVHYYDATTQKMLSTGVEWISAGILKVKSIILTTNSGTALPNELGYDGTNVFFGNTKRKLAFESSFKTITGNVTLDDSYHNTTVWITANATITVPSTVRPNFNCVFFVVGSFTATITNDVGVTFISPFGLSIPADCTAFLGRYQSNQFVFFM